MGTAGVVAKQAAEGAYRNHFSVKRYSSWSDLLPPKATRLRPGRESKGLMVEPQSSSSASA